MDDKALRMNLYSIKSPTPPILAWRLDQCKDKSIGRKEKGLKRTLSPIALLHNLIFIDAGEECKSWDVAESIILHRSIFSWAWNYLIKQGQSQSNGTIYNRMYSVRDYWGTETLASSWFYYIPPSFKKRQYHLGFFGEIDDLWEAGSSHVPPGQRIMPSFISIWMILYPINR